MITNEHVWVVILAAGDGRRVRDLTRDRSGEPAPKQYTSINGTSTLFGTTLARAKKIAPPERIVPVVAAQHRRWWREELHEIPSRNIIMQPENRGTAAGILLPLLWITDNDADAVLVILPSDHGVSVESALHAAIVDAELQAGREGAGLVLLGVRPNEPERGYGWIVPLAIEPGPLVPVGAFREKPDSATATSLFAGGALLNSFILIARGRFLLDLFKSTLPRLWRSFQPTSGDIRGRLTSHEELAEIYSVIPSLDFSKDLLERSTDHLWVYPVVGCGWVDLGTPERLTRHMSNRHHFPTTNQTPSRSHRLTESRELSAVTGAQQAPRSHQRLA